MLLSAASGGRNGTRPPPGRAAVVFEACAAAAVPNFGLDRQRAIVTPIQDSRLQQLTVVQSKASAGRKTRHSEPSSVVGSMGSIALAALMAVPIIAPECIGQTVGDTFSFAVVGHVRGDHKGLHPGLPRLLDDLRSQSPDFVVLTGDMIYGNSTFLPTGAERIEAEWDALDSELASLDVPIYRVPGNHDINDLVTRDVYSRRYGPIPHHVSVGNSKLVFLNSTRTPREGDEHWGEGWPRGVPIGSEQIEFLRHVLTDDVDHTHAFVFLHHHELWWGGTDTPWWRDVHPILVAGKVRGVFSGDSGPPFKFSHRASQGIEYVQSSIGSPFTPSMEARSESIRFLNQQFDNYLLVRVWASKVDIDVRTFGELGSDHYTPERYRAVLDEMQGQGLVGGRVGVPALVIALTYAAGLFTAVAWCRARRRNHHHHGHHHGGGVE